ncbi:hypothetical protein CVT24_009983 [Panaeolus cyanescens]|uniref:Uncharacterized protein n=1 Tax=Panaeolus cyanescens TaxID=181874 RepID=A0A409X481_9AGAR|nr:hypothetical protein CVT24_009983 [Panaeolus cyanescens]
MPAISVSRFLRGQITTNKSLEYVRRRIAARSQSPFFFALSHAMLDVHYHVHIRSRTHPVSDYVVTNRDGVEIKFSMFGAISPVRVYRHPGSSPSKACMTYDLQLHDRYQAMLPINASSQMRKAYAHQLDQVYRISQHVGNVAQKDAPWFPRHNDQTLPCNFELLGPPTYKTSTAFENNTSIRFPLGSPIAVDDHPSFPRDALFDAHQNLHHNWEGFSLIDREVVAIFDGNLKFWVEDDGPLKWAFKADTMHIITVE